jgi:surface protein
VKFNGASSFNADLSRWDVSNVTSATSMFYGAALFNQSLCSWREILPSDVLLETIFTESGCFDTSDPFLNGTSFCMNCKTT